MWSSIGKKTLNTYSTVSRMYKLTYLSRGVPNLKTTNRVFDKLTHAKSLSLTAEVCRGRGNKIQYDDTLFEREYEKSKAQMDIDMDDPTETLHKVARDNARKEQAVKYAKAARLFPQSQEERSLTRDTMEQIRFLKQENEGEWTISKLAASFDVTEQVIRKVLKSKFVPSTTRRRKQDLKACMNTGLLPLESGIQHVITDNREARIPDNLLEDGHRLQPMLSDGTSSTGKSQIKAPGLNYGTSKKDKKSKTVERYYNSPSHKFKLKKSPDITAAAADSTPDGPGTAFKRIARKTAKKHKKGQHVGRHVKNPQKNVKDDIDQFGNFVDEDDQVYGDGEESGSDKHLKLVQKGREFYDENGEFLYRV